MSSSGPLGPLRQRVARNVRTRPERSWLSELAVGTVAGGLAVAIRFALPLSPDQLPTLPAVVLLAIVTTFVGIRAGITTAIVGGLASFYFFFNEYSWSLANGAWIPLLGFVVTAAVIVTTAHLYRSSERQIHEQEIAQLHSEAQKAQLFAREMAHRQKNTLAIVQSIAFQTLGTGRDEAATFAGRLKILAEANALLDEHVEKPEASVASVVEAALQPFRDGSNKFDVRTVDATIAAQQVVSLALALHELATNAVKYGALSLDGGWVSLSIEDAGDRLSLTWKEHGGPEVSPPGESGFGSRLLQRAGTDTRLIFEPDGLCCSMGLRKSLR